MIKEIISEYMGVGEYSERKAHVLRDVGGWLVYMYDGDLLVYERECFSTSVGYAEDAAENWVTGVIKE